MSVFSSLCNNIVAFGTRKSNPRNTKIIGITIHHMAGRMLGDDCARMHLNGNRDSSANYYIGYDGQICGGVSEDRRAWTSNSRTNDHSHITIEVSDQDSSWTIPSEAYNSLIKLCADICKRYNINLKYERSKGAQSTLSIHDMFYNTLCPAPYLKSRIENGQLIREINEAMGAEVKPMPTPDVLYRVQVGAYKVRANADNCKDRLEGLGYQTYLVKVGGLIKVQCGAFANKSNADNLLNRIKADGFDAFITTEQGEAVKDGTGKKGITEVAKEVIAGIWGNNPQRKIALEKAGYDYNMIQNRVNELMAK